MLKNKEEEKMSKDIDFCHSREIYPENICKLYWILLQKQEYMLQKLLPKK